MCYLLHTGNISVSSMHKTKAVIICRNVQTNLVKTAKEGRVILVLKIYTEAWQKHPGEMAFAVHFIAVHFSLRQRAEESAERIPLWQVETITEFSNQFRNTFFM
jgi:hypothetical protein